MLAVVAFLAWVLGSESIPGADFAGDVGKIVGALLSIVAMVGLLVAGARSVIAGPLSRRLDRIEDALHLIGKRVGIDVDFDDKERKR